MACEGEWLIVGTGQGELWAWALATERVLCQPVKLQGHTSLVSAVALEGPFAATGSCDCTVRLWALEDLHAAIPEPSKNDGWPDVQLRGIKQGQMAQVCSLRSTKAKQQHACTGEVQVLPRLIIKEPNALIHQLFICNAALFTQDSDGQVGCWNLWAVSSEDSSNECSEGGGMQTLPLAGLFVRCLDARAHRAGVVIIAGCMDGAVVVGQYATSGGTFRQQGRIKATWTVLRQCATPFSSSVEAVAWITCDIAATGSSSGMIEIWDVINCTSLREIHSMGSGGIITLVASVELLAWISAISPGIEVLQFTLPQP